MEADATMTKKTLFEHFASLEDPRKINKIDHKLSDIIIIAICAIISNADTWNGIETWANAKEAWLKTFLELPHGIPTHDTFNRVFSAIHPKAFFDSFIAWVKETGLAVNAKIISIDGKQLRRSHKPFEKSGLHLVSAWSSDLSITLGQVRTEEKSNEITAIPELLNLLAIEGCTITIDAMGCQRDIAEQIVNQRADYVLTLKGNQNNLHDDVKTYFEDAQKTGFKEISCSVFQTTDKDHGRFEKRIYIATDDIDWLYGREKWKNLTSIVMVISERELNGKTSTETRYYITSHKPNAEALGNCIRLHWSIENQLHWQLDVTFNEDQSRTRTGYGAENFAAVRRFVITLLRQEKSKKLSLTSKRLLAGWDVAYLEKILEITTL